MLTIALSENAVAELRFRVKGWKMPVTEWRLQALRELVDAGIMEPADGDFRFTEDGWARREELLHEAEERIERERFEPPDASHLSEAARELLRRRLSGDQEVTDANRAAFRVYSVFSKSGLSTPLSMPTPSPITSPPFPWCGLKALHRPPRSGSA
jgi:hypothetical protein